MFPFRAGSIVPFFVLQGFNDSGAPLRLTVTGWGDCRWSPITVQQRGRTEGCPLGGSADAGKLRVRSTVKFTSSPLFQVSSSNFRDALTSEVENNENKIGRLFDYSILSKCL